MRNVALCRKKIPPRRSVKTHFHLIRKNRRVGRQRAICNFVFSLTSMERNKQRSILSAGCRPILAYLLYKLAYFLINSLVYIYCIFIYWFRLFLWRLFKLTTTQKRSRHITDTVSEFDPKALQETASEGHAQGPCVADRAGFEPTTFLTKGVESTNEPTRPTIFTYSFTYLLTYLLTCLPTYILTYLLRFFCYRARGFRWRPWPF